MVLPWARRGTEEDCPACPPPVSVSQVAADLGDSAGEYKMDREAGAAGPGPGQQLSGAGLGGGPE